MEALKANSFLLIDDDDIFNMLHRKLISQLNPDAKISVFQSSKEALNYVQEHDDIPEIMLIDIRMPELNGFDLLQEFCKMSPERFRHTKLFFVTSSMDEHDKEKGLSFPLINGYFVKPITINEIINIINTSL